MSDQTVSSRDTGLRLLQAGNVNEAAVEFQKAIAADSQDGQSLGLLGVCYARSGDMPAAVQAMEAAALAMPQDAPSHYNLGMALNRVGRHDDARRALEETLRINPGHTRARDLLRQIEGPADRMLTEQPAVPQVRTVVQPIVQPVVQQAGQPTLNLRTSSASAPSIPEFQPESPPAFEPQAMSFETAMPAFSPTPPPTPRVSSTLHWTPAKLGTYEAPTVKQRVIRGITAGSSFGQLWFFGSVPAWVVVASAKGFGLLLLAMVIVCFFAALYGVLMGAVIGALGLDEDSGGTAGVIFAILLFAAQIAFGIMGIWLFNIIPMCYIGWFIGKQIAMKCIEEVMIEPE